MKSVTKSLLCVFCTIFLCFGTLYVDTEAAAYTAPVITKQPENYYGTYGDTVTFTVEATASTGYNLYYQWFYRRNSSSSWVKFSGATKATSSSIFYKGMDNWQVACLITDGRSVRATNIAYIYYQETAEDSDSSVEVPADTEDGVSEDTDNTVSDGSGDSSVSDGTDNTVSDETADTDDDSDIVIGDNDEPVVVDPQPETGDESGLEDLDSETVDDAVSDPDEAIVIDPEEPSSEAEEEQQEEDTTVIDEDTSESDDAEENSTREYVTPEDYGAKADGVTDDSAAIQKAVDSGKDVKFTEGKTYFIAAGKYITISNKTDFRMSGGTIHKAASPTNYNLFVITGCTDCVFENMYIYSEHTCTDILVPADHTRPTNLSSNVLAFSGGNNTNISFNNNRFDNLSADYWFNGNYKVGYWTNITVDGWTTSTTLLPMYAQYITGLTVTNANVSMNPTYSGDGDHCIYMCTLASDITIKDSTFNWYGTISNSGVTAALTFHGGSSSAGTQPKNILISNCTVNGGQGKTVYTGDGVTVDIEDSTLSYTDSYTSSTLGVLTGYGSYNVSNSVISGYDTLVDVRGTFTADNSTFTGGAVNGIFGTAPTVSCTDSTFNIGGGILYYVSSGSGVNHTYTGCTITKATEKNGYIISKRSTAGSITFDSCTIDCGTGMLMYNGGRVNMTGVTLIDTTITNASMLASYAERSGYTVVSSAVNGVSL